MTRPSNCLQPHCEPKSISCISARVQTLEPHGGGRQLGSRIRRLHWLILIALLLVCIPAVTVSSPTSRPTTSRDSVDPGTDAFVQELNAMPASPTTANAATISHDVGSQAKEQSHLSLIALFSATLITGGALGISASIVGTMVLLRRESLAALAIPQVVAVGTAVALRNPKWPQLPPSILAAVVGLFYLVLSKRRGGSNWILPSLYVSGICLSYLIIANKGQDIGDLQKVFTGIDVAVSAEMAWIATPILLVTGLLCAVLWRRWLLMAQAPAAAELARLNPARWDAAFLFLLTVVVLLGTNALGVVLVLVMLFLPPATVLPWCRRIPAAMAASAVLALIFFGIGFYLSNLMSWPLSQSIGGVGFVALALSHTGVHIRGTTT